MFASLTSLKSSTLLLIGLCIFSYCPLHSQSPSYLDSLKNHLPAVRDTMLFDQLIQIARKSEVPDSALYYGQQALDLALEINDQRRVADAHYRMGQFYEDKGLIDRCIEKMDTVIELCKKIQYVRRHTYAHTHKGYVLNEAGRSEEALQSFLIGLSVARKAGAKSREGHLLVDIGDLYRLQHLFDESINYLDQAMAVFEANDHQGGKCRALFTKASTYFTMPGKAEESIKINFELLDGNCVEKSNHQFRAKILGNIGGAYSKLEVFDKAETYLIQALEIKQKTGNIRSLLYTQNELVSLYLRSKRYDLALPYAKKAYESIQKVNDVYVEYNILRNLSLISAKSGDYKQANYYNGLYNDLRDSIGNLAHQEALAEMRTRYETAQKEKEAADAKLEVERHESRFKNLLLIAFSLLLIVIGFFGWYRFKSRQKALETERLLELDRMKSRYFTNISHELRTPLSLIIDPLQQLSQRLKDRKQIELLEVAQSNGEHMLQMLNQMLDLSKLKEGKMPLQTHRIDLHPTLHAIVASFQPAAEQKRIQLQFISNVSELWGYFDLDKLKKIIYNILGNALKFTPENGEVKLLLIEQETQAQILIRDTGIGITPEQQRLVFDRFYQVDDSSTRAYGGTGIGLSVAKELVELHGGIIELSSEEQKGTQFSILLPLGRKHLRDEQIVQTAIQSKDLLPVQGSINRVGDQQLDLSASTEEQPIVLLIEDQQEMRHYIQKQLSPLFKVITATNGQEGYEIGIDQIPDLIISDVMLPGIDGFEVCRRLKSNLKTSHIPLILLTAKAQEAEKLEGLQAGADEYLYKPFNIQELILRINRLIERRHQMQQQINKGRQISPKAVHVSSMDEQFLQNLMKIIEEKMSDESFGVEELSRAIGVSRSQLHRKIKALTGQSTNLFLREIRLKRALQLLEQEAGSAAEIAYQVGFSNPNYFYKCFKEQFGKTPGQILKGEKIQ